MRTLSGNENFWFDGMPLPHLVGDFWAWSSSDLLKGTLRGALAEFIVATAIGENTSEAHEDRQAWDLEMSCGGEVCKIEVKSSAYINAGARDGLSSVSFSIAPSRRSELGKKVLDKDQARRASDVYVFCLFASKDREAANPLILDDWQFIVIPTPTLDWSCPGQKTISLRSLLKLRSASVDYGNLAPAIEAANRAAKDIRDYIQSFLPPHPDLVYFDDMHNSALCRAGEGGSFTLVLVPVLFMVMVLVMVLVMVTRDFPPTFRVTVTHFLNGLSAGWSQNYCRRV